MSPPEEHSPSIPEPVAQPASASGDVRGGGAEGATSPETDGKKRARPLWRRVLQMLAWMIAIPVGLLLTLFVVVQMNWGARAVGDTVLGLFNPFDAVDIEIGDIRGNWITTLELHNVTLTRTDSVRLAQVDTLQLRYRLGSLLKKKIHVRDAYIAGLVVSMHQQADSTWDLLNALGSASTEVDTTASTNPFVFQIDRLRLDNSRLAAQFYAPGRDSTLRLDRMTTHLADIVLGQQIALRLDTFGVAVTPPGMTTALQVQARGRMTEGRVTLDTLRLDSPASDVAARATLHLPDETHTGFYDVDALLQATPLAFQDIHPFIPSLDPDGSATLDVRAQGTADLLRLFAEARLADGARVVLDGEATPSLDGNLVYRFDGTVRNLDPGFLLQAPATAGRINADLQIDLNGPTLDHLDGTLRAVVFDTRWGDYAPDRSTLRATLTDGAAEVYLETGLRGTGLILDGTLRPLDETPSYDLRGRLDSLDLGRFAEGQSSQINGTFRLTGEGFDPMLAALTATVDLEPSRINQYRLLEGRLEARLADSTLNATTRLRFPEGDVSADGTVQLGEVMRYRITEGRFEQFNLAALLGDTTSSALTGSFALQGAGTDPATLALDELRLTLDDSRYGPYRIDTATLNGSLRNGRLTLAAEAHLDGGAFRLAGTLQPFAPTPAFSVTEGTFEHVDIGTLTQSPDQQSDLTGSFRLSGQGFDPATLTLDELRLVLTGSQLNAQPIDSAEFDATLQEGRLDVTARLQTPRGTTTFAGSGMPFEDTPTFSLREGTLNHLNLSALLNIPYLETDLNGSVSLEELRGKDPRTMTLHARLDLAPSRVNGETIQEGYVDIALEDGFTQATADVRLEQGRIRLDSLTGRFFDEHPTYAVAGALETVDLGRLSGIDTLQLGLSATFGAEGEGFDPATMRLYDGRLDVTNASYYGITARTLHTRFTLQEGLLAVDTLLLHANVVAASGGGRIALFDTSGVNPSDFTFEGQLLDEKPVRPFVGADRFSLGDGSFGGRVQGTPGVLHFEAHASVGNVVYNDIRVLSLDAHTSGTLGRDRTLTVADVRAEANQFSLPSASVRYSEFDAHYTGDSLTFSADVTVDGRRDARLRGRADLRQENKHIILDALSMHLDDDRWQLDQEATITYGDEYRVSNFLLIEDDQEIVLDGVIDLNGEQNLGLTIYDFRLGAIADLFNFPGLDGLLNGDLRLSGPATAPTLTGRLSADVESFTEPVGALAVSIEYDSLRLNLDATLTHEDQSTMALRGYLPLDLRLNQGTDPGAPAIQLMRQQSAPESEVSLRLDADRFNIGWVEPFLDPELVNEVEGRLTAEVDVSGTLTVPVLAGQAALNDGRLGLPTLGVTYTDLRAEAELADNQVNLTHAEVHAGNGSMIAHGTVDLTELTLGQFDISASAESFRAIDTRAYRAIVSADLNLRGTTRAPVLDGTVRLMSADIFLTEETTADEFGPVTLTEEDVQMLERHFGIRVTEADTTTFQFYEALAIENLSVEMDRDVWLRSRKNPEMNIQFTGELELQKAPYQQQQLFGDIEVLQERSFINQFGRRFEIESGRLSFNGPATDPQMDITASYEVRSRSSQEPEITITLVVTGRLDDPSLEMQSDPQTDITNIVSYLATGRPADQAFQLGGTSSGVIGTGAGLAIGQLTNIIENAAGAELGLDVIEIQQQGLEGATITAGKYLSRRLYASVSWPITLNRSSAQQATAAATGSRKFTIEYELFNWLLLRMTSDGSTLGLNLLYEYAY